MMAKSPTIEFVLRERVEGKDVTPSTIGFSRFNEFNQQVQEFLSGTERLKVDEVHLTIEEGSYKLVLALPLFLQAALAPDLASLQREDALGEIDEKRARIVAKWQADAKKSEDLVYYIRPKGMKVSDIEFSHSTDYRVGEVVPWVRVEKYLLGTVMDMGGVQKANVHVRLDDTGEVVIVGTNQGYLREQPENRLYQKALLRVEADQHYKTGELRNYRLLAFENYEPGYRESALDAFIEEGTKAWAGVPDAAEWVHHLRGGRS